MNRKNTGGGLPRRQSATGWKDGGKTIHSQLVLKPAENSMKFSLAFWLLGGSSALSSKKPLARRFALLCAALMLPGCFFTRALDHTIDQVNHPTKELVTSPKETTGWRLDNSDDRGGHHLVAIPGILLPGRGQDDRRCILWLPRSDRPGGCHLVECGVDSRTDGQEPVRIRLLPPGAPPAESLPFEAFAQAGPLALIELRPEPTSGASPRFTVTWFDPGSRRTVQQTGDFQLFRRVRSEGELTALRGLYVVTIAGDTGVIAVCIAAIIPIGLLYLAANS